MLQNHDTKKIAQERFRNRRSGYGVGVSKELTKYLEEKGIRLPRKR